MMNTAKFTGRLLSICISAWTACAFCQTPGVYDVTRYGAVGDGATINTAAIQAAIDEANNNGGGDVVFPPGAFVTGTIYMKSNVRLVVGQGSTVLGSTNLADYPLNYCKYPSYSDFYTVRALIWGEGLENVGITGPGTIDGQGSHFSDNRATPEEVAQASAPLVAQGRHPLRDIYLNRPYLIRLISCRNVTVENIALRNSAMWMQHYLDCDFLTLRGLNVFNHVAANNDMIDIDGCRNVVVADCVGDTDDDALTLKSTGPRATEHVVISNCILRSHCNAIKAGTESSGGFRDITIANCVVQRSSMPKGRSGRPEGLAGIALEIVDGGTLERVSISNIVVESTTAPIFMRLGNRGHKVKPGDAQPPVGTFRDVSISNVVATGASSTGCAIAGLPGHPIENVTLSNVRIAFAGGGTLQDAAGQPPEQEAKYPESTMFGALPAYGFYFRHVRGLRVNDINLRYDAQDLRPPILADDVSDARIQALHAQTEPNAPAHIALHNVQEAIITGCTATSPAPFAALTGDCENIRLIHNDLTRTKKPHISTAPKNAIKERFNLVFPCFLNHVRHKASCPAGS